MKKILLVEDHPIFRLGVRHLIQQRWPEAEIVEAGTLAEALTAVRSSPFAIAVADLNLPDTQGIEVVSQLLRAMPSMRLLVLSLNAEAAYAQRVLSLGAAGYLTKDRASAELIAALERISGGGRYITASLAEHLANLVTGQSEATPHEALSPQEFRVMLALAAGNPMGEIAESMHVSPKTVSTYRSRVLEKLGLKGNADLARYCLHHGLLSDGA